MNNRLGHSVEQIQQQMADWQLGLLGEAGAFLPAPVSFTPWQLTSSAWSQALEIAAGLTELLQKLTDNPQLFADACAGLLRSHSVPGELTRRLSASGFFAGSRLQSTAVSLMRHDLLLDQQGQWRWVESNSIAAGMGPLNQRWLQLAQQLLPDTTANAAANPAAERQGALLAAAAWRQARRRQASHQRDEHHHERHPATPEQAATLVFVVTADEDNLYDQQLLASAIAAHGVTVRRLTCAELLSCQLDAFKRLRHPDGSVLDLLYWRTGYNPGDYPQPSAQPLWQWRQQLENADVAQCPTMALQLVSSKYVQAWLSQQLLDKALRVQLAQQLGIAVSRLELLAAACVPQRLVQQLDAATLAELLAAGWWYKRQDEGGGNVAQGDDALRWAAQADAADLLMAPIHSLQRQSPQRWLRHGRWHEPSAVISELGIFSASPGLDGTGVAAMHPTVQPTVQPTMQPSIQPAVASYAGYLLRSKPAMQLEGGVHRGGAVLDLVGIDQ